MTSRCKYKCKIHIIYQFTSPDGTKYIGRTSNLRQRRAAHRYYALILESPSPFHRAIREIGFDNFELTELACTKDFDEAVNLETMIILENLNSGQKLYNVSLGPGMLGAHHTPESKQKLREANTGYKFTPEQRQRVSRGLMGRVLTGQHRENLRKAVLGRKMDPEVKARINYKKRH